MATYSYAIIDEKGAITNIACIDDQAVGFDDAERGKWEPWGHDRATKEGWVLLHGQLPSVGWVTSDGGKTFVHPDDPTVSFTASAPLTDSPDFVQPATPPAP